jgi:hypothetical protein
VPFASGSDPACGSHTFMDGDLQLWANNWMVLRNHLGSALIGRYLGSAEKIDVGYTIQFPSHFAHVLHSILPPSELRVPDNVSRSDQNWL